MNIGAPRGLAVVTGASAGIGLATAQALQTAGYAVLSASRRLKTTDSASTGIATHHLDVTDADSVASRESATVVRDGDAITVTDGYHSFVAAAEHEFYYLWALAGDHRDLAMKTDPRHRWICDLPLAAEP